MKSTTLFNLSWPMILELHPRFHWPKDIRTELQFSIPIYSLTGIQGCKQYLAASEARESLKKIVFAYPDITKSCLVCSFSGCATWKGYYSRSFFCPILDFDGRIWIRKGLCKTKKVNFSMLPDFCIPYLRWSKFIFVELLKRRFNSYSKEFDWELSFSTLYWIGSLLVKLLRINSSLYLSLPPSTNSVHELKIFSSADFHGLVWEGEFDWNKKIIPSALSPPV